MDVTYVLYACEEVARRAQRPGPAGRDAPRPPRRRRGRARRAHRRRRRGGLPGHHAGGGDGGRAPGPHVPALDGGQRRAPPGAAPRRARSATSRAGSCSTGVSTPSSSRRWGSKGASPATWCPTGPRSRSITASRRRPTPSSAERALRDLLGDEPRRRPRAIASRSSTPRPGQRPALEHPLLAAPGGRHGRAGPGQGGVDRRGHLRRASGCPPPTSAPATRCSPTPPTSTCRAASSTTPATCSPPSCSPSDIHAPNGPGTSPSPITRAGEPRSGRDAPGARE